MKVRIKPGAVVARDLSVLTWKGDPTVFDVEPHTRGRYKCVAHGYGCTTDCGIYYGAGPLLVRKEDVIEVTEDEQEAPAGISWIESEMHRLEKLIIDLCKKVEDIDRIQSSRTRTRAS